MERFIAQKKEKESLIIENEEFKHFKIKRITPKEEIEVFYKNNIYICQLEKIEKNKAILKTIKNYSLKEPKIKINIFQAVLIQLSSMDQIIYKIYESGAYSFTPIISKRSYQNKNTILKKYPRWQKIILNAFKQTKANYFLKLNNLIEIKEIANFKKEFIVLDNFSNSKNFKDFDLKNKKEFNILIGPEGGFSQEEINYFKNLSFDFLKLKPHIFKSENIGLVITSLILNTI